MRPIWSYRRPAARFPHQRSKRNALPSWIALPRQVSRWLSSSADARWRASFQCPVHSGSLRDRGGRRERPDHARPWHAGVAATGARGSAPRTPAANPHDRRQGYHARTLPRGPRGSIDRGDGDPPISGACHQRPADSQIRGAFDDLVKRLLFARFDANAGVGC